MVKKQVHTSKQPLMVRTFLKVCIYGARLLFFFCKLLHKVNVHGKADRHMPLLKIEAESMLATLWDQEECNQFARRKSCGQHRERKK
jgi:hypothetical protein